LNCSQCGAEVAEGAAFCAACGQRIADGEHHEPEAASGAGVVAAQRPIVYAGFWLRAAAFLIDLLVIGFPVGVFVLNPLMERAGIPTDDPWALMHAKGRQAIAINLLGQMAFWLYWALLESSAWQATLGKKMLGLQVTDLHGRRISFARASGRFFGKVLSSLTVGMGYVMAGFTYNKQALHDRISNCLVLKKT
jgi:uncharacterized RDD family membrane protein YckC